MFDFDLLISIPHSLHQVITFSTELSMFNAEAYFDVTKNCLDHLKFKKEKLSTREPKLDNKTESNSDRTLQNYK